MLDFIVFPSAEKIIHLILYPDGIVVGEGTQLAQQAFDAPRIGILHDGTEVGTLVSCQTAGGGRRQDLETTILSEYNSLSFN